MGQTVWIVYKHTSTYGGLWKFDIVAVFDNKEEAYKYHEKCEKEKSYGEYFYIEEHKIHQNLDYIPEDEKGVEE